MGKKNIIATFTIASGLVAVFLSGCAKQSESTITKTNNANQSVIVSNTNSVDTTVDLSNNSGQNNSGQINSTQKNNPAVAPAINGAPPSVSADTPPINKKNTPPPAVKEPEPQIGNGGNDLLLVIQTRNALRAEKQLLDTVVVDSKDGNVVLTGKVANAADKAKAAQLAQGVKGAKSVKNNITVSQ